MSFTTQPRKHFTQHLQLSTIELDESLLWKLDAVEHLPCVNRRTIRQSTKDPTS